MQNYHIVSILAAFKNRSINIIIPKEPKIGEPVTLWIDGFKTFPIYFVLDGLVHAIPR